ncbi:hypothetical protein F66182_5418 [Fusarium sp. NRRL 66182]|nr:hypothetical protein F66182_5418 [Fusarium sp. NRRL 66182]
MSSKKIMAIVGATGTQGGSVARTFLNLPDWHVRALTRRSTSPKAAALKMLGAEVVEAHLGNVESLAKAFEGVHAIFVNTDFWATYLGALADGKPQPESQKLGFDTEISHARNAALAAQKIPTLEKYIYSALGPMNQVSKGKYSHSYHWETKAAAVKLIETEMPELSKKTSFIYVGVYATNAFLYPKKNADGEYEMLLPSSKEMKLPILDTEKSTGPFVQALVEEEPAGTKLLAYDSDLTVPAILDIWNKVTGKGAKFEQLTEDEMHHRTGLPFEVLDGAAYLNEHHYTEGIEGVITPEQLKKPVKTASYEEYIASQHLDHLLSFTYKLPDPPARK